MFEIGSATVDLDVLEPSLLVVGSILVVVGICVYLACLRWYRRLMERKPFPELPMPPSTSPLGHLKLFQTMFKDPPLDDKAPPSILQYTNEYGQVGIWVLRPTLMVTHYEDARTVLAAEYHRKSPGLLAKHARKFLGDKNIGLLEGRDWRIHRSAILRSLNPASILETARGSMIDVAQTFTTSLTQKIFSRDDVSSPSMVLAVEPLMKMITIDIFARTNLSVDLGCCHTLKASPIAEAFDFLLDSFKDRLLSPMHPLNYFYFIPTTRNLRHEKEHQLIRSFLYNLIQERKLLQTKSGFKDEHQDVLSNLLQANLNAKEAGMKAGEMGAAKEALDFDESMDDTLMALLFAGYDTTSITLTYALFCVAQNPEIEERCLKEIWAICGRSSGRDDEGTTIQDLDPRTLVYCRGVLLETLRIYPPAGLTTRFLKKPIKLRGGFVAPSGCAVVVPIEMIQRSERHFERPTEFIPERWVKKVKKRDVDGCRSYEMWEERLDKVEEPSCTSRDDNKVAGAPIPSDVDAVAPAKRSAFLAFSSGARSCPGSKFAIQEAILVFAILLRRFKFESLPDYVLKPVRKGVVQHPNDGIPMTITVRE
jgi:cytochrome P450